ncbi:MAG: polymer-forming cytoskeletal protein [Spirochaetaceae bacterium]|jgi:cytoskeletal protein CcmA (bactofilin family)|nr:polymer-forming cytoskeletal protein [Spirochaetaceae bacterium]
MPNWNRKEYSVNTLVGPGTTVKGVIESAGFTRIDGNVQGDVEAQGRVYISEKARLKSSVRGTAITVGGVVSGDIVAKERVIILSSALILGDVITRRIQADEGCLVHGRVRVCQNDEQWDQAVAEQQDARRIKSVLSGHSKPG